METNRNSGDADRSVASVVGLVRRTIGSLQQQQAQVAQQPQSAEQELNHRFNIPRGSPSNPVCVAGGQSAPTSQVASVSLGPLPCQNPEGDALASNFNPQQNYGYSNYNRRARRAPRSTAALYTQRRSSNTARFQPQTHSKPNHRVEPPFKEIILLPNPGYSKVPKYKKKVELHKQGFILDSVPIERCWSEVELRGKIQTIF